jgi:hypothetical protein
VTETFATQFSGLGEWLLVLGPMFLIAYFIPFFIATGRKHRFNIAIGLINLLLGWTVIGWFAALIWAVNRDVRETDDDLESPAPMTFMNEPRFHERSFEPSLGEEAQSRKCSFCAESIRAEALVCRYCGRDVAATAGAASPSRAVNIASMEENIQELQALLKDHAESVEHKSAEIGPATNYVPPQQEVAAEVVPLEVAHQLSGWKKFG